MNVRAGIIGIGMAVPDNIVTNVDLEKVIDTSDDWIRTRTGIVERRHASEGEATSDYAIKAAKKALSQAQITADEIDLVIVATVTGDYQTPATASIVQDGIGASRAAAFDLGAGCAGWVYALTVADGFIRSGMYRNILVVGADLLSRITNWNDRGTCILLGDGAGAAVVSQVDDDFGIITFELGSDGSGADRLKVPAGGSRKPCTSDDLLTGENKLMMDGKEVYKFASRKLPETIEIMAAKAGICVDKIDLIIPHQANLRIIETSAKVLGVSMEKMVVNIDRYGNTSSGSIPIAICEAYQGGRVKKGGILAIVGFGAGLTWGGLIMQWAY